MNKQNWFSRIFSFSRNSLRNSFAEYTLLLTLRGHGVGVVVGYLDTVSALMLTTSTWCPHTHWTSRKRARFVIDCMLVCYFTLIWILFKNCFSAKTSRTHMNFKLRNRKSLRKRKSSRHCICLAIRVFWAKNWGKKSRKVIIFWLSLGKYILSRDFSVFCSTASKFSP